MKFFSFTLLILLSHIVISQRLVWLQQTPGGSVVVHIQPEPIINPYSPDLCYDYWECREPRYKDSLFTQLNFHSPRYGNLKQKNKHAICFDKIDFAYSHLIYQGEWINNTDLYSMLRVHSNNMMWEEREKGTWELTSSEHRYICGNDKTGHTETDHQIWKFDSLQRIKTITQLDEKGQIKNQFDYTYTAFGKLKTMREKEHYSFEFARNIKLQWEWFYDSDQRLAMILSYNGESRKFTAKTIARLKKAMVKGIKAERAGFEANSGTQANEEGESNFINVLDSNQIKVLIVYNYGKFGLEQANCYYHPDGYSNIQHFYSDSLFYNHKGKITHFKGGKNSSGEYTELHYSYDTISGRLSQFTGLKFSPCTRTGCLGIKLNQTFSYANGLVNNLNEKRFYLNSNLKRDSTLEALEEEWEYTYQYKLQPKQQMQSKSR